MEDLIGAKACALQSVLRPEHVVETSGVEWSMLLRAMPIV